MNTDDTLAFTQVTSWYAVGWYWFGLNLLALFIFTMDESGLMVLGTIDILKDPRDIELDPENRLGCGVLLVLVLLFFLPLILLIQTFRLCRFLIIKGVRMIWPQ